MTSPEAAALTDVLERVLDASNEFARAVARARHAVARLGHGSGLDDELGRLARALAPLPAGECRERAVAGYRQAQVRGTRVRRRPRNRSIPNRVTEPTR
jgi:hypothetical protein